MTEEKPVVKGRRTFLATAVGTIVGAIVTGVGVWALTPKGVVEVPKEVIKEVTTTITAPGATVTTTAGAVTHTVTTTAPGVTKTVTAPAVTTTVTGPGVPVGIAVMEGETVTERALNGVKKLKAEGKIVAPARVKGLVYAGTAGSYTQWKEQWEAATGTELVIEIVPIEESYDKLMLEATSKTGEWDFFATDYAYRGDFYEGGLIKELTEWTWKYDPILYGEPDGVLYPLAS